MTFSVVHATKRMPKGWMAAAYQWWDNAIDKSGFEVILAVDVSDIPELPVGDPPKFIKVARNHIERSSANAYNAACAMATGEVLICGADDVFAPYGWDASIEAAMRRHGKTAQEPLVLWAHTGNPRDDGSDAIITQPIMTRPLYERWGYMWYPGYVSMYADDDLTEHAKREKVIFDLRGEFRLEHRHPRFTPGVQWDNVYSIENCEEAYQIGFALLALRRSRSFTE